MQKQHLFEGGAEHNKKYVSTTQVAADRGSGDPRNQENKQKRDLRANTLHTLVFSEKYNKCANLFSKNDTFGVGKPTFVYILDLGAQSSSKGVHKVAQGRPWYSKWSPKGFRRVRHSSHP